MTFEAWLLERGYSARSRDKILSDARTMQTRGPAPETERKLTRLRDYRWAWDLYETYRVEAGAAPLGVPRPELPTVTGPRRRRAARDRVLEAVSFPRSDLERILAELDSRQTPVAAVVRVVAFTGLRVADVLRCDRAALGAALAHPEGLLDLWVKGTRRRRVSVNGSHRASWERLHAACENAPGTIVAEALSGLGASPEANHGPYARCAREVQSVGEAAGVTGRLHLHRFRRTIAVQILASGGTLEDVSKTLGQSVRTAQIYSDEAMAAHASTVLDRVHNQRKKDPS